MEIIDSWNNLKKKWNQRLKNPQFGWKLMMIAGYVQVLVGTSAIPIEPTGAILAFIGMGCAIRGAHGLRESERE